MMGSGATNHERLMDLVWATEDALRSMFLDRWRKENGQDFKPELGPTVLGMLDNLVGKKKAKNLDPVQRGKVESGLAEEWDLTLLAKVLQCCKLNDSERGLRRLAQEARNEASHAPKGEISEDKFDKIFSNLASSLLSAGYYDEKQIDDIRNGGNVSEFTDEKLNSCEFIRLERFLATIGIELTPEWQKEIKEWSMSWLRTKRLMHYGKIDTLQTNFMEFLLAGSMQSKWRWTVFNFLHPNQLKNQFDSGVFEHIRSWYRICRKYQSMTSAQWQLSVVLLELPEEDFNFSRLVLLLVACRQGIIKVLASHVVERDAYLSSDADQCLPPFTGETVEQAYEFLKENGDEETKTFFSCEMACRWFAEQSWLVDYWHKWRCPEVTRRVQGSSSYGYKHDVEIFCKEAGLRDSESLYGTPYVSNMTFKLWMVLQKRYRCRFNSGPEKKNLYFNMYVRPKESKPKRISQQHAMDSESGDETRPGAMPNSLIEEIPSYVLVKFLLVTLAVYMIWTWLSYLVLLVAIGVSSILVFRLIPDFRADRINA